MSISDKFRYNTDDASIDTPGLGESPALRPLNKLLVRSQLSFMNRDSLIERERAVKILISRISDYYEVIGYVGPYMSKTSEIGYALGGWNTAKNMNPWRQSYLISNNYAWATPEKIFHDVRYSCFETALKLAAWEIGREVPESSEGLKLASWCARNAIQHNSGHYWPAIRNRFGSKGMRKVLAETLKNIDQKKLMSGLGWLGHFSEVAMDAA